MLQTWSKQQNKVVHTANLHISPGLTTAEVEGDLGPKPDIPNVLRAAKSELRPETKTKLVADKGTFEDKDLQLRGDGVLPQNNRLADEHDCRLGLQHQPLLDGQQHTAYDSGEDKLTFELGIEGTELVQGWVGVREVLLRPERCKVVLRRDAVQLVRREVQERILFQIHSKLVREWPELPDPVRGHSD